MGRLYDKADLAWNMDYWDRQEQQLHADIANGLVEAAFLNKVVSESRQHTGRPCGKGCGCRSYRIREGFDLERKRERMKLLRTGSLLRELDVQRRLFEACPFCTKAKKKNGKLRDVPCMVHRDGLTMAKSAVYWAGNHNVDERNFRGQRRAGGLATAQEALEGLPEHHDSELNQWESQYQRDKAEGIWPKDADYYDVSPDYKGWLNMLFQNEEITEQDYLAELQRIRDQERDKEQAGLKWAGQTARNGARKGKEVFRRDTRYNLAV